MTTATIECKMLLAALLWLCSAAPAGVRGQMHYHERVGGCQIKFAGKGNFKGQQLNYILGGPPVMAEGAEHTRRIDNSNLDLHMA